MIKILIIKEKSNNNMYICYALAQINFSFMRHTLNIIKQSVSLSCKESNI